MKISDRNIEWLTHLIDQDSNSIMDNDTSPKIYRKWLTNPTLCILYLNHDLHHIRNLSRCILYNKPMTSRPKHTWWDTK